MLKNEKIPLKIKLSALWIAAMLCYIYGDIIGFYQPGFIKEVIEGKMGPLGPVTQGLLFGVAIFLAIPAVMVFLSLILTPEVNRWTNIILGLIYTAAILLTMLMGPWIYYYFLGIIEVFITSAIVGYAWKWPRQPEP